MTIIHFDGVSILGAALVFWVCWITARLLSGRFDLVKDDKPIHSLDGLRGILALFVFLHHSMLWYNLIHAGVWGIPGNDIFINLGKGGVAIFFMTTALLFLGKAERVPDEPSAWTRLLTGRVFRIMPLYLTQVLLMVLIVGWKTGFQLNKPALTVAAEISSWVFCLLNEINGFENTWLITAGVAWSLAYEWLFYFSLPVLARGLGSAVPRRVMVISILLVGLVCLRLHPLPSLLAAFGGGAICFFLGKSGHARAFSNTRTGGVVAIASLVCSFCFFRAFFTPAPLLIASLGFSIICMGSDLFGLLRTKALRVLGELSYGIYLFHGIFLYGLFDLAGLGRLALPLWAHWAVIAAASPILIVTCFLLNRFIERPGMSLNPSRRSDSISAARQPSA